MSCEIAILRNNQSTRRMSQRFVPGSASLYSPFRAWWLAGQWGVHGNNQEIVLIVKNTFQTDPCECGNYKRKKAVNNAKINTGNEPNDAIRLTENFNCLKQFLQSAVVKFMSARRGSGASLSHIHGYLVNKNRTNLSTNSLVSKGC